MNSIEENDLRIAKVRHKVEKCKKCNLCKIRKNSVFGEGDSKKGIMLIGEAPGKNEDNLGRPFVGRSGKLLDSLIQSIGLERKDIYITNIVKCRPPKNRNPLKGEINACKLYLNEQISIIQPKVIATLGNFSSLFIFDKFNLEYKNIGLIHGHIFKITSQKFDTSIVPLYHPAAAIYNPNLKKVLIEDFKSISKALLSI